MANSITPFEIIVVDSKSKDNTKAEAYKACSSIIYLHSPDSGPAEQRNHGASIATGDIFCFIDADTIINKNFLEKVDKFYSKDFEKRKIISIFPFYLAKTWNPFIFSFFLVQNILFILFQFFRPLLGGMAIVIPRDLFFKVGQFSNKKRFEDLYLAYSISKVGGKVRGPVGLVFQSVQRFINPFNALYTASLYILVTILNIFNINPIIPA